MVNTLMSVLVGLTGLSLLLTAVCIYLALKAVIELEAIKKSTHKVEVVQAEANLPDLSEDDKQIGPDLDKAYKSLLRRQQAAFPSFEDYFGPAPKIQDTSEDN